MQKAIEISLKLRATEVLPGERLSGLTSIRNIGQDPYGVPAFDSPTEIEYELQRTSASNRGSQTVSFAELRRNLGGIPERTEPEPRIELAPQHWLRREEDLALLTFVPYAPGEYTVRSRFDGVTSEPAQVRILEPRVERMSLAVSRPENVVRAAFIHLSSQGAPVLLERESRPDPRRGVFFRRDVERPAIYDIAVCVDAAPIVGGHWYASLASSHLSVERAWGDRVEGRASIDTELERPRLVQPGLQQADTVALFLVAGLASGAPVIDCYAAATGGVCRRLWRAPLGSAQLPARIAASFGKAHLALAWQEGHGAIVSCALPYQGGIVAHRESATVFQAAADDPIALWELSPYLDVDHPHLHVVTRSAAHRAWLAGSKSVEHLPLAIPAEEPPMQLLATMAPHDSRFPILARRGERVAVAWADLSGAFQDFQPASTATADDLWRIFCPGGTALWASRLSPRDGLQYFRVSSR